MKNYLLSSREIQQFLPHRSPFLLVDRILKIEPLGDLESPPPFALAGTKVLGLKNITFNEFYFPGHFPDQPIVPGVLLIETMAQTASFSIYPNLFHPRKNFDLLLWIKTFKCILVGVNKARFRKPVVPGDSLLIETKVQKVRGKTWIFECQIMVDNQLVSEAEIIANLMNSTQDRTPS